MKLKFEPSQVKRVEEVTTRDGHQYRRVIVTMTPEQRAEYRKIVAEEEKSGPPRAAKPQRLETVFAAKESAVLDEVDQYAAKNNLPNRSAVVRVALSQLLGIKIAVSHRNAKPARTRKAATKGTRSTKAKR